MAPPPPEAARYGGGEFREERDLDQVHIVLGFPSAAYGAPLHYPSMLLSTLLGGGMSSRLFQEIRERRGLVYSIYSFAHPFQDSGLFAVYAGTGEKEAEELVPVTLEELRRVQRDVTQEELDRAKAQLRAGLLMSLESTGSRAEQLASPAPVHGRVIPVEETKAKIAAVTIEQVQEAAATAFRGAPTLAALGPAGKVPAAAGHRRGARGMTAEARTNARRPSSRPRARPAPMRRTRSWSTSASLSVQRRLGKTEQLERAEGFDLGLRVFVGDDGKLRQAIVSSTDPAPAGFAALAERAVAMARAVPEDPYRRPAPTRRTAWSPSTSTSPTQSEPDAEALIARAAAAEEAALAVAGVNNSEGAEAGYGRRTRRAGHQQRLRRRVRAHQPLPLRHRPGRAGHGDGAGLRLLLRRPPVRPGGRRRCSAAAPGSGRSRGSTRPGRRPRGCRWSTTRASPPPCSATSPGAINGAAVARGTSFLKDRLGQRVLAGGPHRGGRPDAPPRPALPPLRRRGHEGRAPRDRRGRRADHLDPRLAQRPPARHGQHRPCQPRHRRPALALAHQPVAGARRRHAGRADGRHPRRALRHGADRHGRQRRSPATTAAAPPAS